MQRNGVNFISSRGPRSVAMKALEPRGPLHGVFCLVLSALMLTVILEWHVRSMILCTLFYVNIEPTWGASYAGPLTHGTLMITLGTMLGILGVLHVIVARASFRLGRLTSVTWLAAYLILCAMVVGYGRRGQSVAALWRDDRLINEAMVDYGDEALRRGDPKEALWAYSEAARSAMLSDESALRWGWLSATLPKVAAEEGDPFDYVRDRPGPRYPWQWEEKMIPGMYEVHAAARARNGEFKLAVEYQKTAIACVHAPTPQIMLDRLQSYRSKIPWGEPLPLPELGRRWPSTDSTVLTTWRGR